MSIEPSSYQQQLARHIKRNNPSLSERIIQAFSQIPRHLFVDHYYLHEPGNRQWTRYEREESETWYEQIYRNDALVTHVDHYGRTLSSSSQPDVMAYMLQALDVQEGMRVLEIGTGSGYNAAILAQLAGSPRAVTTIDIDADVIARARETIPQVVGDGMTIVQADGRDGYQANAPYHRIMITAGTPTLPHAWLKQLAPDGILVGVLQPKFAMSGGLLQAQKHEETLSGRILRPASFMELRPVDYRKRGIHLDFRALTFASFPCDARLFHPGLLRGNPDFTFFLYYDFFDLYVFMKDEAFFVYQEAFPHGYVVFQQKPSLQVELRGDRAIACSLWNRLIRAYTLWNCVGQPTISQYEFEMDCRGQALLLLGAFGKVWPFGVW